jgi:hypothetical protein
MEPVVITVADEVYYAISKQLGLMILMHVTLFQLNIDLLL